MNIPNIKYTGEYSKIVETKDGYTGIQFYKNAEVFNDLSYYNKFIKAVEAMVRSSNEYSKFKAYIRNTLGVNFCQVSSQILDTDAEVELHHGPIFTLYDYVSIVLNKYIDNNIPITTFAIANEVIDEHFNLRVQCVMLTKTNHEATHNRDIFLNIKQGIGNISEFIEVYKAYLTDDQKYKIHRYIAMCKDNDSFDNGILDHDHIEKVIRL